MVKPSLVRGLTARSLFLHSIFAIAGATLTASDACAATGKTQGSFEITANGAATYSIPIFAPPGPRGIQPSMALVYNSHAGNGEVGRGWSIAGLSAIARCERTVAQDGVAAPIELLVSDGYCFDGNQLRMTSGTAGVRHSDV